MYCFSRTLLSSHVNVNIFDKLIKMQQLPIIPAPQHCSFVSQQCFELKSPVEICVVSKESRAHEICDYIAGQLREHTDLVVKEEIWAAALPELQDRKNGEVGSTIVLQVLDAPTQGTLPVTPPHPAEHVAHEAYSLSIGPEGAGAEGLQQMEHQGQGPLPPARCQVTASTAHGLFNGCQSLLQVCPDRSHMHTRLQGLHRELLKAASGVQEELHAVQHAVQSQLHTPPRILGNDWLIKAIAMCNEHAPDEEISAFK